jgi:L-ascorbate metabolism protein UlaG (beta-lactamase superfamily)
MKIRWLGHGSFKIKSENTLIYIDPYSGPDSEYEEKADIILISQGQYDHFDMEKIKMISMDSTRIITNHQVASLILGATPMKPGDRLEVEGIGIHAVQCIDREIPRGPSKPRIAGNVVELHIGFRLNIEDKIIYYASDTAYYPGIKENKCDIALLPIGGTFTMDAQTAAKAASEISPRAVIPMNYGRRIMKEEIDNPAYAEEFKDALSRLNPEIKVLMLAPGEFITF